MRTRNRLAITLGAMLTLAAATTPYQAGAAGTPGIVSGPGSWLTTYTQPLIVVSPGDELLYANLDAQPHDVIADFIVGGDDHKRPDGSAPWCYDPELSDDENAARAPRGKCPLFWSRLIPLAQNTPVLGLEDVAPGGIYDFTCSIHRNMFGKLVVLPA